MRITRDVELVVDAHTVCGEGPLWDERGQLLIWLDVLSDEVRVYDPSSGSEHVVRLTQTPGCVALRASGGFVVATPVGFHALDLLSGQLTVLAPAEADNTATRMNDGKVDPAGRLWAGTMGWDGTEPVGCLYRLDRDRSVSEELAGITVSNGLGWSPDGHTMYYVDTPTHRLDAFDFDPDTGHIDRRREFAAFPKEVFGDPDGMCDAEGFLWVATWGSAAVRRIAPDGTPDLTVILPVTAVSSWCIRWRGFSGPLHNDRTLRTVRARTRRTAPRWGLFRFTPGVTGQPIPAYAG